jgi:hypothetical protein
MNWVVWGDSPESLLEDNEDNCKAFVENNPDRLDLYIASPDGKEFVFDNGRWVEA